MQLQRVGDLSGNSVNKTLNNNNYNTNSTIMGSRGVINSPVLCNRSFLHGDIVNNKKHETIDSLALRRTSLPLQLVPTDIVIVDNKNFEEIDILSKAIDNISCQINSSTKPSSCKEQSNNGNSDECNEVERVITTTLNTVDDHNTNKADIDSSISEDLLVTWENTETRSECELTRPKRRCQSIVGSGKLVVKPKWIFTSTMMHYVPRRYKRTKKFSKSWSKNNGKNNNNNDEDRDKENKNNNKNLPRTVSLPTDFVHVAGIRRWSWLQDVETTSASYSNQTKVITHEEKCATLTLISDKITATTLKQDKDDNDENISKRSSSVETLVYESVERFVNEPTVSLPESSNQPEEFVKINSETQVYSLKPQANVSFLWSTITKCANDDKKIENKSRTEYNHNNNNNYHHNSTDDNHDYDDVGPSQHIPDETYDDVGVPKAHGNGIFSVKYHKDERDGMAQEKKVEERDEDYEQVYDDVIPQKMPVTSRIEAPEREYQKTEIQRNVKNSSIVTENLNNTGRVMVNDDFIYVTNADYSTIDEDADDEEAVYDDVGVLYESRVNSIYAGSIDIFPLDPMKESEWEDVEEFGHVNEVLRNKLLHKGVAESQSIVNKKKPGQKRMRKVVRRQRSKASRKNSARSSKRLSRQSTVSVAVSLGTGSVLLVGSAEDTGSGDNDGEKNSGTTNFKDVNQKSNVNDQETQGLVQLRTVDRDEAFVDIQETSCYVLEDTCSDDSNYETLFSFESHNLNDADSGGVESMSDHSSRYDNSPVINSISKNSQIQPDAPMRPVPPPPPRESNLSGTIGKRMKMLKRTWSITKGSLGRMRRKASSEVDTSIEENGGKILSNLDNHSEMRKGSQVFNFKKHFQRSNIGTSTFYLDNENDNNNMINNSNNSIDEIYQNSNWSINSNYSSAQENYTDDYNILAEEPLYQFYAASTCRGAFQSDSDSYGDADDLSSLPSTSDLGRPGHRTLWCQTPQVIKSDLLERLTSDEKKLQEAKFEIITSEASYLNSLRVLVNEFLINHELVYEALSSTDREKLFGNVPSVLIASERLLAELESVWRADPMLRGLPDVLLRHAERCSKIYVEYCSNQVSIDLTLKELKVKKSSKFVETITRIESHPACQSLSLHSFLMLPMQRVTRLPLLGDAVLSKLSTDHVERLEWEKVLSVLGKVVTDCNEGARVAGRLIEMHILARKLEYSVKVPPIELRDRYLVRSGSVTQMVAKPGAEYVLTFRKKYHKTPLYLLLLTDHLLVAKLKTNGQDEIYSVIDSCKRSVVALEKVPEDSPFAGRHAMILTLLENFCGRHVEYILSCQSATERERWLDAVSPPKPSLVGETLYETWDCPQVMALYSYTPIQPDELSLQPGDVINVLRKMADGWNLGEKLVGGEQGWFPGNYTKEVASEHVRARNLRQRHRLLALTESFLLQYVKQTAR